MIDMFSREAFVRILILQCKSVLTDCIFLSCRDIVIGKACDWFQKGAVIGYHKEEIQVNMSLVSVANSVHFNNDACPD